MLELEQVAVVRNGRTLLRDIELTLAPGSTTALIGPNGAGKSTLIRAMSGEIAPAHGRVLLDGVPLGAIDRRELASRRAVLAQASEANAGFTVAELVALGPAMLRDPLARREAQAVAAAALDRVDLAPLANRPLDRLSGGERQRAHLARVLAQLHAGERRRGPGLLLLDEPTAAQDLAHQMRIMDIATTHARAGGAVCVVLHDLNWAARVADRIVVLACGSIHAAGSAAAVLTQAMLAAVFDVDLIPGTTPHDRPFVLPQTARPVTGE